MALNTSYPRKYYFVAYSDLSTIPEKAGNIIATYDTDGFYYDVPTADGSSVVRRKANGIEFVGNTLPVDREEPTTIFVVETGTTLDEDGNSVKTYSGYRWNDDLTPAAFEEVFNNLRDFKVKSVKDNAIQAYLVGSVSENDVVGTLVKNSNIYITTDGKIHADIDGVAATAEEANHAASATLAQQAVNDNATSPKPITGYLNDVVSDATTNLGSTITFTRGDGTTKSVRVSDTTYGIFTASTPGLVNKTSTTVNSDTSGKILCGDGWIATSNITMPVADKANKDSAGQTITSTYYKNASISGTTLTLTKGDGTTTTNITIPDTTYNVFTTTTDGLAPKASGTGATAKFLRGDASWQTAITPSDVYVGSTAGIVPAAGSGNTDKYLRNDGTWAGSFATGSMGLVPAPTNADTGKFLKGDGTWASDTDTTNTAGALNDTTNALYVVGATAQNTSIVTNTNQNVYISGNKLYQLDSDAATPAPVQVVDVSSVQALTNKTYEGMTLGTAAAADVASTVVSDNDVPTNTAVITYTNARIQEEAANKVDNSTLNAPMFSEESGINYTAGALCQYDIGNGDGIKLYKAHASTQSGTFDTSVWDLQTVAYYREVTGTLTAGSTSLVLTDNVFLNSDANIQVLTSVDGVAPLTRTLSGSNLTLTFIAQASNVNVKVRVS